MDGSLGRESLEQVRWSETKRGSSNRRRKRRGRGRGTGKKRERAGTGESQSVSAPPSESEKTAPLKGNRQCQPHQAKMEKKKKSLVSGSHYGKHNLSHCGLWKKTCGCSPLCAKR